MSTITNSAVILPKIPFSLPSQRNNKFHGPGQDWICVRMTSPRPRLKIQTFAGLRASTSFLGSSGPYAATNLFTKMMNNAPLVHRGRPKRGIVRAMFERFSERAIIVVRQAQEESRRMGHNAVGTEHILLGLISEGTGIAAKVLRCMRLNLKETRMEVEKVVGRGSGFIPVEIPFSPRAKLVLEHSLDEARKLGQPFIGTEHLLLGLLREGECVAARVLEKLGVDPNSIRKEVVQMIGETKELVAHGPNNSGDKMQTLQELGVNLTKLAQENNLDPVVGRQPEIQRVIEILGRRTKNNPCLIGQPGVGKTAIVEGLAQRIASGDVPETIEGKQVISLDMSRLIAGTKWGEFEDRMKKIMEEITEAKDVILFIDDLHTRVGARAANILKPALGRRGVLQCIGAARLDQYRQLIEKDPTLARRFLPVQVPEPTVDQAIQILRGLQERYEIHHKVGYTEEAIEAAVKLSSQFISDRFLPVKAIHLIDEAGAKLRLRHAEAAELRDQEVDMKDQILELTSKKGLTMAEKVSPMVSKSDIREVVSMWTGIPVQNVSSDESDRLLKMEETLHARVKGQDEAVRAVSSAIRRAHVGLNDPNRPIASFIFSGPTGVGKTELAKALASYYFGSEESMVRLDMSEFMERHTVAKLIGSPPGYVGYTEGGQLTEAVRRRPHTLVLFDKIEKAHSDVFNIMLQILEDGRLTDSMGRTVNFRNTILIMTSNLGSSVINKGGRRMGFDLEYNDVDRSYNRIKNLVVEELKHYFKPKFLNRLDDMIVFRQLTKAEVKEIADIMFEEEVKRVLARGIEVQVTERFKDRVVDEGYDPSNGARPLRRAISKLLMDNLTEKILAGEIHEGDSVIFDVDSGGDVVVLNGSSCSGASSNLLPV